MDTLQVPRSPSPAKAMNEHVRKTSRTTVHLWSSELVHMWIKDGKDSFHAFDALLHLLQATLDPAQEFYPTFAGLIESFPSDQMSVKFLQQALPSLIDSDFLKHTDFVDLLLLYLSMHQINTGTNLLQKFVHETPYFGGFYLRQHGKHFQDLYEYIRTNQKRSFDPETNKLSIEITPHYLACMHVAAKKVIVSNAPPVKLKRRRIKADNKFECEVSAGGLVTGIRPSLEPEDIWVSYLEAKLLDLDRMPKYMVPKVIKEGVHVEPRFRRSTSVLRYSFDEQESEDTDYDSDDLYRTCLYEKAEGDFMSLQRRLSRFAQHNFVVNPLIIMKEDHKGFYDGISNGLFWPAFHNLTQYIIDEYRDDEGKDQLALDWQKYVKVNFHFAIHAARSCRTQDFLWIHDYHLFLVGDILRSLDPTLDCGFFLHIPFRLSVDFINEFREQGLAVLKALLGFTRVGFQSNKDTLNFVKLLRHFCPDVKIENRAQEQDESLVFIINYNNRLSSVGTFPISISMEKLLAMNVAEERVAALRDKIMKGREGKLFLSVERFDYTKGILERLEAIWQYLNEHPERATQDAFYQVAAASRTEISSYREYQRKVMAKMQQINMNFSPDPDTPIFVVDRTNRPQEEVVKLYQAADVIVVTPLADGMNLVVKEGILCNPNAIFLLSIGAGAENQLFDAGLGDCYLRLEDPADSSEFSSLIFRALSLPQDIVNKSGEKLHNYTKRHDIGHWIKTFNDPNWTHFVMPQRPINTIEQLKTFMADLLQVRRETSFRLMRDLYVGKRMMASYENALKSLKNAALDDETIDLEQIVAEVEQDIKTMNLIKNNCWRDEWIQAFSETCGTPVEEMKRFSFKQINTLESVVDLVIVRYDHLISHSNDVIAQQSLTNGFLVHRFLCRYAKDIVLLSNNPYSYFTATNTFPEQFGIFSSIDCARVNHKQILAPSSNLIDRVQNALNQGGVRLCKGIKVTVLSDGESRDDQLLADWLISNGCDVSVTLMHFGHARDFCAFYTRILPFILKTVKTGY